VGLLQAVVCAGAVDVLSVEIDEVVCLGVVADDGDPRTGPAADPRMLDVVAAAAPVRAGEGGVNRLADTELTCALLPELESVPEVMRMQEFLQVYVDRFMVLAYDYCPPILGSLS